MPRVIAIDGPAASGKSSVSRGVASALGFLFVSSGHFYRALAWGVARDNVSEEKLPQWIERSPLEVERTKEGVRLLLHGNDATPHLSDPEVAAKVSLLAIFPEVRDLINERLRALAATHDLVMEGRDIGSIVFPETPFKFYLDASPAVRARRRAGEGAVDSVAERDRIDSTRATAPLTIPKGATVIDTTHLGLDEVITSVLGHLQKSGAFPAISR
ncbi:MAG: (d)CMP kinase [Verrucomicrobiota bacterium]